ncbi:MAG: JAB domain-containing protein [Pirellulales bacterium]
MKRTKKQLNWNDNCIREVRVNYLTTEKPKVQISGPSDIAEFVRSVLVDNSREQFFALYLEAKHNIAAFAIITIGTANQSLIHPREVFQRAILVGATSLAVAHNHPSGNTEPSKEDLSVTLRLKKAGVILGIELLDHVIVTDTGYTSLCEEARL